MPEYFDSTVAVSAPSFPARLTKTEPHRSQSPQPPHLQNPGLGRHQIPQRIGGFIPADPVFIGIRLQHVAGPIRIMFQRWQRLEKDPPIVVFPWCLPTRNNVGRVWTEPHK